METPVFSKIKDVDLKILSELDDASLFKACSANRYLFRICNAEPSFWRNRYVKKYGEMAAKYKPKDRSWKNHYMQTVIDLEIFRKDPVKFLDHIIWGGTIENSFFLPPNSKSKIPFIEAPEWAMTNFWLLDLGEIKIDSSMIGDFLLNYETYSHLTPHDLLTKLWDKYKRNYIKGLTMYAPDRYMENVLSINAINYLLGNTMR